MSIKFDEHGVVLVTHTHEDSLRIFKIEKRGSDE